MANLGGWRSGREDHRDLRLGQHWGQNRKDRSFIRDYRDTVENIAAWLSGTPVRVSTPQGD
jgi:hypothetical protein